MNHSYLSHSKRAKLNIKMINTHRRLLLLLFIKRLLLLLLLLFIKDIYKRYSKCLHHFHIIVVTDSLHLKSLCTVANVLMILFSNFIVFSIFFFLLM